MGIIDRLRRKAPLPTERSDFYGLRYMDLEVCDVARRNGLVLDQPVHALFYLYFPGKDGADAAAGALGAHGLTTTVREPTVEDNAQNDTWGVIAESRTNALIPDFLRDTIDACEAIAAGHGGEFDGWEAGPADAE